MIISSYVTIAPGIWLVTAKRPGERNILKNGFGSIAQARKQRGARDC